MQRFTLKDGRLDPERVEAERNALKEAIEATLGAWRGRRASPVYQQLPNLKEPDWKTLKVGDINQFWQALESWQSRVEVARQQAAARRDSGARRETPNSVLEFEALRSAARALCPAEPPALRAEYPRTCASTRAGRCRSARTRGHCFGPRRALCRGPRRPSPSRRGTQGRRDLGLLARTWKDEWTQIWNAHPQRKLDPVPLHVIRRRHCKAPPPPISRHFVPLPATVIRASTG